MESPNRFTAWLIPYNNEFEGEEDLINIVNVDLTRDVNNEKHADLNIEPIILFNKEKGELLPLPQESIMEKYEQNKKRLKVSNESLIRFKGRAFSVEPQYINCNVDVEEIEDNIHIYYKGKIIETYDLKKYQNNINYKKEHYCQALAQSYGSGVKPEDVEQKALENLKNLSMLGGIVNDIQ